MRYLKHFLLWLLLFMPLQNHSQVRVFEIEDLIDRYRIRKTIDGMDENRYSNVQGSPYLFDDFEEGEVTLKNGSTYKGKLKYDIYANEVLFLARNIPYALAYPEDVECIQIGGVKLIYTTYTSDRREKMSYFSVVKEGNCRFLAKPEVHFSEAVPAKPYVEAKPASFDREADTYYFKVADQPAIRITNKSGAIDFFETLGFDITEFLKKEKLNFKNKQDLLKLADHANNLLRIENVIE